MKRIFVFVIDIIMIIEIDENIKQQSIVYHLLIVGNWYVVDPIGLWGFRYWSTSEALLLVVLEKYLINIAISDRNVVKYLSVIG